MKGLCHSCLTSDLELVIDNDIILCYNCFGRIYSKRSPENDEIKTKATFEALKKKWEK